jgi:hypothetical protein
MLRIDFIERHKLCHLDGDDDRPSSVGLSEPIIFQLATSFVDEASSLSMSPHSSDQSKQRALRLSKLSRLYLDVVNVTLQDAHSKTLINDLHRSADNFEAIFLTEASV